jgi:hypothetical protein
VLLPSLPPHPTILLHLESACAALGYRHLPLPSLCHYSHLHNNALSPELAQDKLAGLTSAMRAACAAAPCVVSVDVDGMQWTEQMSMTPFPSSIHQMALEIVGEYFFLRRATERKIEAVVKKFGAHAGPARDCAGSGPFGGRVPEFAL